MLFIIFFQKVGGKKKCKCYMVVVKSKVSFFYFECGYSMVWVVCK